MKREGRESDGSAWRLGRRLCFSRISEGVQKVREIIHAVEDWYLEVYVCQLDEFLKAGDMKEWYGHLKGRWRLKGKEVGSRQYIRDDD